MAITKDDLLQTIVSIAFAGAGKPVPEAYVRAVRQGEAEMESEFEGDDFTKDDYAASESDSIYDSDGFYDQGDES